MKFHTRSFKNLRKNVTSFTFLIGIAAVAILASMSTVAFFQGVPVSAAVAPNILAPTVTGSINTKAPGTEAFWSQITPLVVPLTTTDNYGGTIQSVSVKIATNGTYILMQATYTAAHHDNASVTTGAPVAPAADQGLYFANATIHRSDQFAVWWSMSQTPGPPPCMQVPYATNAEGVNSPGSIAGTGNVWRWVASSTDNEGATFATAKYGAGTGSLAGHLINYTHPFASDMLLNTSGFFILGMGSSNINSTVLTANGQTYPTYVVYEKGVYNYTAHTYTQVIARPMTVTPTNNIVQFQVGTVYNFALAMFSGGPNPIPSGVPVPAGWTSIADNGETKSISTWVTLEFTGLSPVTSSSTSSTTSSTPTPSTSTVTATSTTTVSAAASTSTTTVSAAASTLTSTVTQEGGFTFEISTAATLIALIIGLVVGIIVVGGRAQSSKNG